MVVFDFRLKGHWLETDRRYCVVSLGKTLYPLRSTGSTQKDMNNRLERLFVLILYIPVNKFSVVPRQIILG